MAFVGIINEQEFYSQHYLDENLSGDIAGWVKEKEAKEKESREAFNKLTEAEKNRKRSKLGDRADTLVKTQFRSCQTSSKNERSPKH